jgi:hypothetical protein
VVWADPDVKVAFGSGELIQGIGIIVSLAVVPVQDLDKTVTVVWVLVLEYARDHGVAIQLGGVYQFHVPSLEKGRTLPVAVVYRRM